MRDKGEGDMKKREGKQKNEKKVEAEKTKKKREKYGR